MNSQQKHAVLCNNVLKSKAEYDSMMKICREVAEKEGIVLRDAMSEKEISAFIDADYAIQDRHGHQEKYDALSKAYDELFNYDAEILKTKFPDKYSQIAVLFKPLNRIIHREKLFNILSKMKLVDEK